MGWPQLLLESIALSALAAAVASSVIAVLVGLRPPLGFAPARGADVALMAGLLPMFVAMAVAIASVLPSALQAAGVRADHCQIHHHHRHLCALHLDGNHVSLMGLGVLAVVVFACRGGALAWRQRTASRAVTALLRLGQQLQGREVPLTSVPGSAWLCFATGVWRPRVVVSATLLERLRRDELRAALAHEEAHLHRHDTRQLAVLVWAGLFALPWASAAVERVFREAAEEACDAEAAAQVGPVVVAKALVAVAGLQLGRAPTGSLAFGDSPIERRVVALLAGSNVAVRPLAPVLAPLAMVTVALVASVASEGFHHAIESLIQRVP